jgi:hypothetical protein
MTPDSPSPDKPDPEPQPPAEGKPDILEGAVPYHDGPLPQGLPTYKTKFDALVMGVQWCVVACLFSGVVVFFLYRKMGETTTKGYLELARTFWILLGVSTVIGALLGHETHRLATGDRKMVMVPWQYWVITILCCGFFPLPFLIQHHHRVRMFVHRDERGYFTILGYLALGAFWVKLFMNPYRQIENFVYALCFLNATLLFVVDCLIVNQIAAWGRAINLAPRHAKFQFTLGSMLTAIFMGGFYITVLLKLFNKI